MKWFLKKRENMPALSQDCLWWFPLLKSLQKRSCSISIRQVSKHLWLQRIKQYSQFQCRWRHLVRSISWEMLHLICSRSKLSETGAHSLLKPPPQQPHREPRGSKRAERIKNRAVSSTSECLIMKETGVSGAGNTHQGECSNYRGVGKCSFYCIFKAVIEEISAKRSAASRNCQSCLATGSSAILSWVFHNRWKDSWNACLRTDKEKATLFCTRRLQPCSKAARAWWQLSQHSSISPAQCPAASRQMGLPQHSSVIYCTHTKLQ